MSHSDQELTKDSLPVLSSPGSLPVPKSYQILAAAAPAEPEGQPQQEFSHLPPLSMLLDCALQGEVQGCQKSSVGQLPNHLDSKAWKQP